MGLYLRDKIYWMSYISSEGVHKRESTECKDKSEAEAKYYKLKADTAEGIEKQKSKKIKFEEFADKYLEKYSKVENKSWKKSDWVYIQSLKRYFLGYSLSKITHDAILGFRAKKKSEGTKDGGINRILACLKSMFNRAIEWNDFNGINPMKLVNKLQEPPGRIRFLEEDELNRLVKCCEENFKSYVLIAFHTGLRLSEQLRLKWNDVDFKNNFITIHRTKSGKMRTLHMNDDMIKIFNSIPKQEESPFIFCDKDGRSNVNVRGAFDRAKTKAKITDFHWHDIRHTTASHLAMKGIDLYSIKDHLGHSTLLMTERYAHLSKTHKENVVSVLNGMVGGINRHQKASVKNRKNRKLSNNSKSVTKTVTISNN